MNKFSKKRALSNLLLLSALFSPGLVLAQDGAMIVEAIRQMDNNVTGQTRQVQQSVVDVGGRIDQSNQLLKNISDKSDISNREMVNALINYAAKTSVNAFALEEEKFFQMAPGALDAIVAADLAAKVDTSKEAVKVSVLSLINSLSMLSTAESINIFGIKIKTADKPPMGALQFYQAMKDFFTTGDTSSIQNVNVAGVMQTNVLTNDEINPLTKDRPSQTLVNVLTNPFPTRDDELRDKLKNGENLTGEEKEKLGMVIAQYALVGVSANAWADIVARRTVPTGSDGKPIADSKTMMEILDVGSKQRFTNKGWYAGIAAASETALLREIAEMMAYNQWVQYQQYRLIEQQVSLLASINGVMAKLNTSMDMMTAEMRKAQAEAKVQEQKAREEAAKAKLEAEQAQKDAEEAAKNAPKTP